MSSDQNASGLSWGGFNLYGNRQSIAEAERLLHEAGKVPILQATLRSASAQPRYYAQMEGRDVEGMAMDPFDTVADAVAFVERTALRFMFDTARVLDAAGNPVVCAVAIKYEVDVSQYMTTTLRWDTP